VGDFGAPERLVRGDRARAEEVPLDRHATGSDGRIACPPGSGAGPLGGSRPAALKVPAGYDPALRYPLVIELHGRGGNGAAAESAFKMGQLADAHGLFVIAPDGTLDSPPSGTAPASFWNATDGCCNLYGSTVDDVAYLRSLICHARASYAIDPKRVYVVGHSNGGFMAHRLACDASDLVTAIISIAGVTWKEPARCQPAHAVSVLQIHGTKDAIVPYDGTSALVPGPAPSAPATYETWAKLNGCAGDNAIGPIVDFDQSVPGNETVTLFKPASATCRVRTELWAVVGGGHAPSISSSTREFFVAWLKATPANH
jgi:polyhydroxybutyrate depolymerase